MLIIGDAPSDFQAAREAGTLFFPIVPGKEEGSWQRFYQEGLDRFIRGTFAGAYAEKLTAEFHKQLPDKPPLAIMEDPILYTVCKRKNQKHVRIRVNGNGTIRVSAPEHMSRKQIARAVENPGELDT